MYTFPNILHFLLIVMPVYYAIQLFTYKHNKSLPTNILGFLMLAVSIYYFSTAKFIIKDLGLTKVVSTYLYFLFLAINPFYFLYTKSLTTENFKCKRTCLLHYLPSFLLLIYSLIVSFWFSNPDETQNSIFNDSSLKTTAIALYNLQILGYTIGMFILLRQHDINIKNYFSFKDNRNNLNWLKIFLIIYVVFSGLDLMVFYLQAFDQWDLFYYPMTIIFFGSLGYFGIKQSDIYAKARITEGQQDEEPIEPDDLIEKKHILSEERSHKLMIELISYMKEKKPFKNHELSIFTVANALKVNKTYISYVINANLQENFSSFVNRYRIEEAKNLLTNPKYDNYTIEGIANIVGFNSKSSFNNAFKKYTGTIPSQFKKNR